MSKTPIENTSQLTFAILLDPEGPFGLEGFLFQTTRTVKPLASQQRTAKTYMKKPCQPLPNKASNSKGLGRRERRRRRGSVTEAYKGTKGTRDKVVVLVIFFFFFCKDFLGCLRFFHVFFLGFLRNLCFHLNFTFHFLFGKNYFD